MSQLYLQNIQSVRNFICWLIITFCSIYSNVFGQIINVSIPPFDINSGLPSNNIHDIVKDNAGYFWVATENGISRFDGYHFENFNSTSHPNIFKDNRINHIKKSGDLLYILTEKDGLIELNPKKLAFKKLSNDKPLSIAFSNDTIAFLFDTGHLVVKQNNKILFKEKTVVGPKASVLIYQGDLLLSANKSDIYRINLGNPSDRLKLPMPKDRSSGKLALSPRYGVVNWNGWRVFILKNNEFVEHPEFIDKTGVNFFEEEPSGDIIRIDNGTIPHLLLHGTYFVLLFGENSNLQYRCICRVNDNSAFIGTNQGLVLASYAQAISRQIFDNQLPYKNQTVVRRRIIEHDNSRYFLGFPYVFEQKEGNEMGLLTDTTFSSYDGLIFNEQLYFTTEGSRTLVSIDLKTKKLTTHIREAIRDDARMTDISIFSDSLLLMTGENKITAYNPKNKSLKEFSLSSDITINTANQIEKSNFILLGTSHGLFRVKLTRDRGFEYIDQPCNSILEVRDILFRETQNEIWLATNSGVAVLHQDDFKITRIYSNAFEVSHPKVTALIEDHNGNIWASTFLGITVYNTNDGTIRFLNQSHGILNKEFNYYSSCLLENGNIIFGGLNGFELIDPLKLNDFVYSKTFHISGIERIQNDKTKEFSNYMEGETISFRTGIESMVIHLAHFDFQFKKGYLFRYTLDGNNWFEADEKGRIILSDLSYGEYTLKVQMFDPFRNLVEEKSFQIVATAPFYVKTSFHVLLAIFILVIIMMLLFYISRSYRIRAATKAKIAMDLHDESGTILTRLLLLSKKEKFEAKEKELIQSGLKEALYSFRTYLDSISNKSHSLQDLSDDMKEFIASACSDAGIQFNFKMDFDRNYEINRELYRDVKLSVYEIVTNCLKHSNADLISVVFRAENKMLFIQGSDNGVCDLTNLEAQKGNGIRNILKRALRNKGYVRHFIQEGQTGLTTEIQLPIL